MAQIFHPSTNTLARVSIIGGLGLALGLVLVGYLYNESPLTTQVNLIREQPVQFTHSHHVSGLGIDCRYCHTTVEKEAFAGIPPTYTCMSCHSQVWTDAPILAPIRQSLAENRPIHWQRVHDLPDFVYFHHGIHVQKGIGCTTCHGRVDKMPLMWKAEKMSMTWCLNCHRNPEKYIRPRDQVFNMAWKASDEKNARGEPYTQLALGRELVREQHIPIDRLTNCSVCHR